SAMTDARIRTRETVPIPKGMLVLPLCWNPFRDSPGQCRPDPKVPACPAYLTSPKAVDSLRGNLPITRLRVEMGSNLLDTEPALIAAALALIGPDAALSPLERALAAGIAPAPQDASHSALRSEIEQGADPLGEAFGRIR